MKKILSFTIFALFILMASAQVSQTVNVTTPGTLSTLASTYLSTVTNLTVTGNIDARDVLTMRDNMPLLAVLDMSAVSIKAYTGYAGTASNSHLNATTYPANEMPIYSFRNPSTAVSKTTLKTLTLPISLTSIGSEAFAFCSGITEFIVAEANLNFSSLNGVLFNKNKTSIIIYPSGKQGAYNIPNSVTSIADNAFQSCTGIKGTITLPALLTSIGTFAFYNCSGITLINSLNPIPPTLGTYAFTGVSPAIVCVPSTAFAAYKTATGWSTFNIAAEKHVTFNNPTAGSLATALITAGYGPLSSITHLTLTGYLNSVDISQMKTNMTSLTLIDMSGTTIVGNAIPANAFQSKTTLTSVILPTTITSIGDYAFDGCTFLSDTIPLPAAVTSIGNYAYQNCKSLSDTLNIPNTVSSIGSSAFSACSGFSSLSIGSGVTSIGNNAFTGCAKLSGALLIPASVISIGTSAFSACSAFTSLSIGSGVSSIGDNAFNGCTKLSGDLLIPASVTSIGISAFQNCTGFKNSLTINEGVKTIGASAFSNCSGFTSSLTIPNTVTSIGTSAFSTCSGFTSLSIGSGVTTIGDNAFNGCTNLSGTLLIPASVTSIGISAFQNCKGFKNNLTINEGVKTIGSSAFSGCSGFTGSLTLPNTITSIGTSAFSGCSGFTGSLTLPNAIITISSSTFSGCTGFTGILTIPLSVTSIGSSAFNGCSMLTELYFSKTTTTTIADNAFNGCVGLTKISIPRSTPPTIYTNTFKGVNKESCVLEVPTGSSLSYQTATFWSQFVFVNEKDFNTSISFPSVNNNIKVYSAVNVIIIEGTSKGELVALFTINGKQLQSQKSVGERIVIPVKYDAVYLVKTAGRIFKVML